jgi:flagellar biosynthesis anti-sigma factor FlgM
MRRKIWNSWTFSGTGDEGRQRGATAGFGGQHGRADRRRGAQTAEPTWLERSFQERAAHALEHALDLSEVRLERVERVRAAIARGTYHIPARDLAQKLMKTMLGEFR